ncbi:transcriptional regulator [Enterobacteriaceae bacterium C23F]
MFVAKFLNWDECSQKEYEDACLAYGYNCESSPEFLSFMIRNGAPLKFYAYKKKGQLQGSVCVDGGWLANDVKNNNRSIKTLPIPKYSIYLPVNENINNILIPFKSKCVHFLQRNKFSNVSYRLFNDRSAAISKRLDSDFSKKTISTREREVRKFVSSGGSFVDVKDLNPSDIFDIYNSLYFLRRGEETSDREINKKFFLEFHKNLKGEIMFINDEPLAIQLILAVKSKAGFFADYINVGYKQDSAIKSVGTILMWNNLKCLSDEAEADKLPLYYSYGFMSGEYKERWCNPEKVGRVIIP